MNILLRYTKLYLKILSISLKTILEYRLNFALQMTYGPMYAFTLYLVLIAAYSKADTLAGWPRDEGILLFLVFHLLYMIYYFFFMKGIREMLWSGIRMGDFDTILTKPVNAQFYVSTFKPNINQLFLVLGLTVLFFNHLLSMNLSLGLDQIVLFSLTFVMGIAIAYFVVSSYATIGFYVTKAAQILEFFDKATDSAQYPIPIFPQSIQLLAFTLVPIAFFSYVPTLFLLGRGSAALFGLTVFFLVISISINQWLWKRGLQQYSSASS